jgi:hypothetical protein
LPYRTPRLKPRQLQLATALFLCLPACTATLAQSPTAPPIQPSGFIQRIDSANNTRFTTLVGYTAQEHYAIYRNGAKDPSAEMTVETVYTQSGGKQYTQVSHSGSEFLRHTILEKILANEFEVNKVNNRAQNWLTSANYELRVNPVKVTYAGHDCYLVSLTARRKSPSLFNGRAWFDSIDASLVRLEGSPAKAPTFLAGDTSVARDYTRIQGFSMATHAEAHSQSFLFGNTLLTIDYTGYKLTLAQPANPPQSH